MADYGTHNIVLEPRQKKSVTRVQRKFRLSTRKGFSRAVRMLIDAGAPLLLDETDADEESISVPLPVALNQ